MEKKFKSILERYFRSTSTKAEEKAVASFASKMQENGIAIADIQHNQWLKNQMHQSILAQTSARKRRRSKQKISLYLSSFVLVFALSITYYSNRPSSSKTFSASDVTQQITLEDNSVVTLFPGAQIIVDPGYNQSNRSIVLSGKAFFDVQKNKDLAFKVVSADLETSVLGTSFLIDETPQATAVEVHSGQVQVKDKATAAYVLLLPKEKARFENGQLLKYSHADQRVSSLHANLNMADASFEQWKRAIEQEFDIRIRSTHPKTQTIKITGDYRDSSLQDILDSFCFINNLNYELQDSLITLN